MCARGQNLRGRYRILPDTLSDKKPCGFLLVFLPLSLGSPTLEKVHCHTVTCQKAEQLFGKVTR